jgi:hypothetical protein
LTTNRIAPAVKFVPSREVKSSEIGKASKRRRVPRLSIRTVAAPRPDLLRIALRRSRQRFLRRETPPFQVRAASSINPDPCRMEREYPPTFSRFARAAMAAIYWGDETGICNQDQIWSASTARSNGAPRSSASSLRRPFYRASLDGTFGRLRPMRTPSRGSSEPSSWSKTTNGPSNAVVT